MAFTSRHDAWAAGSSYDAYMGRWSRPIATRFLDWIAPPDGLDWLELGCGTGALTEAIVRKCAPASILALDPSEGFLTTARQNVDDPRIEFRIGDASSLASVRTASRDIAVAALVLNFVPDRVGALREMRRIVGASGTAAFYVWDYPGGGIQFMRAFWTAAVALDATAADLSEDRRFPFCSRDGLLQLAHEAGWAAAEITAIEVPCLFRDFDDYWRPFTLGAGPAPGYCASLEPEARQRLRDKLSESLPSADGSIALVARAWALKV